MCGDVTNKLKQNFFVMLKLLLKKVYAIIPFKKQLFTLLKHLYVPPQVTFRHLHFTGWFSVEIEKGKTFSIYHYGFEIENEIFWKGLRGWEATSLEIWIQLSKTSSVILDVGANTGIYSLIAKSVNSESKVHAFEPVHRVCAKLIGNIQANGFDVVCHEVAVSNYDGEAIIYDRPTDHIYSVTVNRNTTNDGSPVIPTVVTTKTLRSIVERDGLRGIDLIKIDVEMHEPEVLEGLGEYLEKFTPILLIEILTDEVALKVNSILQELNYEYYKIYESKGLKKIGRIVVDGVDGYNFLAISTARKDLLAGLNRKLFI
jgi:FkbM family methyltransferase